MSLRDARTATPEAIQKLAEDNLFLLKQNEEFKKALIECKTHDEERLAADQENRCPYNSLGDVVDIVNKALGVKT